jgi:hypothetical protein
VFGASGRPDEAKLRAHFAKEGRLDEECAARIVREATTILKNEETLLRIEAPLTGSVGWGWASIIFLPNFKPHHTPSMRRHPRPVLRPAAPV